MQPRQLTVQAPVDEQAADLRHEAAEQLPIGDCLEHHVLAAQGATQAARQRRALGLAERHRAAHAAPDAALGLVVELAIGDDDRLQMIGAPLRRDQCEKVPESAETRSRVAISVAAVRLTEDATQGRAKNARSSGSRANCSATASSSCAITSTWLRSRASSKSAFA